MRRFFATLFVIALFAGLVTIGLAIALVLLGVSLVGVVYYRITGKHPLAYFVAQPSFSTRTVEEEPNTIDADYEVIEESQGEDR